MTASKDTHQETQEQTREGSTVPDQKTVTDVFDLTTLRGLESFDDAFDLLTQEYGQIEDASRVIGSGFSLLDKTGKARLVGEPFLILHVMFPESMDYRDSEGNPLHYAVAHLMTKDGRKFILIDGGTGIYQQLEEWSVRTGRQGGLYVGAGLRESTYDLPDGTGEGTTYYLAV